MNVSEKSWKLNSPPSAMLGKHEKSETSIHASEQTKPKILENDAEKEK